MKSAWLFTIAIVEVIFSATVARADVLYSTAERAYASYDYFGSTSASASKDAGGSSSLTYSTAGPHGGTYTYSGSAKSSNGTLGVYNSTKLENYGLGSYVGVKTPGAYYSTDSGMASASSYDDSAMILGDYGAFYSLILNYELTGIGTVNSPNADFQPIIPTVSIIVSNFGDGFGSSSISTYAVPEGPFSVSLQLQFDNIPGNTLFGFYQEMQAHNGILDSYNITDNNPFASSPFDFDPSHIIGTGTIITDDPYSAEWIADFSHTLKLVSTTVLDEFGNEAPNASLVSGSGINYPGSNPVVPEPSTAQLALAAILSIGARVASARRFVI